MRPLTEKTPKSLLKVGGVSLLERHIVHLKNAGFLDIVINVSYLADQIINFCDSRQNWGVKIQLSIEKEPLETAGGVINALPLLGESPFLLLNADIWTDFDFKEIISCGLEGPRLGHLILVKNPPEHPFGDFELDNHFVKPINDGFALTYSGIGIYSPLLFSRYKALVCPLRPILDSAIENNLLTGQLFRGRWYDVGTPGRLSKINESMPQF